MSKELNKEFQHLFEAYEVKEFSVHEKGKVKLRFDIPREMQSYQYYENALELQGYVEAFVGLFCGSTVTSIDKVEDGEEIAAIVTREG